MKVKILWFAALFMFSACDKDKSRVSSKVVSEQLDITKSKALKIVQNKIKGQVFQLLPFIDNSGQLSVVTIYKAKETSEYGDAIYKVAKFSKQGKEWSLLKDTIFVAVVNGSGEPILHDSLASVRINSKAYLYVAVKSRGLGQASSSASHDYFLYDDNLKLSHLKYDGSVYEEGVYSEPWLVFNGQDVESQTERTEVYDSISKNKLYSFLKGRTQSVKPIPVADEEEYTLPTSEHNEEEASKIAASGSHYNIKELRQKLIRLTAIDLIDELGKPNSYTMGMVGGDIIWRYLYIDRSIVDRDGEMKNNIIVEMKCTHGCLSQTGKVLGNYEVVDIAATNYSSIKKFRVGVFMSEKNFN